MAEPMSDEKLAEIVRCLEKHGGDLPGWAWNDMHALVAEVRRLREAFEREEQRADKLSDRLIVALRRVRVLRGSDALTSASSRGVVIWLKAILGTVASREWTEAQRHLRALIETLEGEPDAE